MAGLSDRPARSYAQSYWRDPITIAQLDPDGDPAQRESEFVHFADYLPALCWMARSDGYIFWYNARWYDYTGTRPDQMEGWGWQIAHDPDHLPKVMAEWTAAIDAGEPFEMIFPLRGADGVFRPFLTRVVPVRDPSGTIIRWFGINTEVGAQFAAEQALRNSEAKFAVLTDAMPQMVWSTLPDGFHDYYNAQWYAYTGVPEGSTDGEGWNGMFHPEDQERAWARWRQSLEAGEPYEIEYRLRHRSGEYRWVLGRALPVRDRDGTIIRWIGTCTDIHEAKLAAEHNELLNRELSHRIKNIFAVISGLVSITGRQAAELRPVMAELLGRIAALGRAHEFARPHSPHSAPEFGQSHLHGLLRELLDPYRSDEGDRVVISGDDVAIDDRGATPIALVIHELATNSAKYGSLSTPQGRLAITVARNGDMLTIDWRESGGPTVNGPPIRTGFGTHLAELSVGRQLGGAIARDWQPEGLRVTITLAVTSVYRSAEAPVDA